MVVGEGWWWVRSWPRGVCKFYYMDMALVVGTLKNGLICVNICIESAMKKMGTTTMYMIACDEGTRGG